MGTSSLNKGTQVAESLAVERDQLAERRLVRGTGGFLGSEKAGCELSRYTQRYFSRLCDRPADYFANSSFERTCAISRTVQ